MALVRMTYIQGILFVILCSLLMVHSHRSTPNIHTSTFVMKQLLEDGDDFRMDIESYLNRKRSKMYKLLDEVMLHRTRRYNNFTDHPINALKMIRSLHTVRTMMRDIPDVETEFISRWPTDNDLEGAYTGLVRLQKTYKLPSSDLHKGFIQSHQAEFSLDQLDLVALATETCENGLLQTCDSWVSEIKSLNKTTQQTSENLVRLHTTLGHYEQAYDLASNLRNSFDSQHENVDNILNTFNVTSTKTVNLIEKHNMGRYEQLCRGKTVSPIWRKPGIVCLYRSLYLPYVRYREEVYSLAPWVSVIYNITDEREIQFMKNESLPIMESSTVGTNVQNQKPSKYRVTQVAWLRDFRTETVSRIDRRLTGLTGLSTDYKSFYNIDAEYLQVANYGIGGQYEPHLDDSEVDCDDMSNSVNCISGLRVATLMMYLSDVTAGGATVFPELGLQLKPVKYAAAFWFNADRSGRLDTRTLHAGCPLLLGEKWVANKWFRNYGQMFRRPCGINVDDLDTIPV